MPDLKDILVQNFLDINPEYEKFAQEKDKCRLCEMYDHYKQVAQSEGCASHPIFMFIGEAYGKDEAAQVRPFIGRAGQRLREELRKHKVFTRKNTIMSNVLSCRPKDNKFPQIHTRHKLYSNNERSDAETSSYTEDVASFCASNWLFREIALLQPKVIVTLGAVPLQYVCGESRISEKRGEWLFLSQFRAWALPTFHPSYVLRCEHDPQKSFVPEFFRQDIARVAETWQTIVSSDYRMKMSLEDWRRHAALSNIKHKHRIFAKVKT